MNERAILLASLCDAQKTRDISIDSTLYLVSIPASIIIIIITTSTI
jgi:hypothetical protein